MTRLSIALLFVLFSLALNGQSKISGVFQVSEAEIIYESSLSLNAFLSKWDALQQQGYHLHDVETFKNGVDRKFWGIWLKSDSPTMWFTTRGWANFIQEKRNMAAKGFLLTEIEGYAVTNEVNNFMGVWVEKDIPHKVWKLDSREGLQQKTEEMARLNFFLKDVEAFAAPNKTLTFLALYHKGTVTTPRNYVYLSDDLKTFKTALLQREKSGFRMVDFERFEEKEITWYLGVFEKGDYNTVFLLEQEKADFDERWDILEEQGMKLLDIEMEK